MKSETVKYFVDQSGNYIGGFDGALPPDGSTEVAFAPDDARQKWNGSSWDAFIDYISSAQAALDKSDMVALRCLKAGISFPADWQEFVALARQNVNGATNNLVQPFYPSGS